MAQPVKTTTILNLDLWPTTLTYNPRLAKVKVNPHAKNQGQRSNGSNRRARTPKQTHWHYQTYYLPCFAVDKNVIFLNFKSTLDFVQFILLKYTEKHPNYRAYSYTTLGFQPICIIIGHIPRVELYKSFWGPGFGEYIKNENENSFLLSCLYINMNQQDSKKSPLLS